MGESLRSRGYVKEQFAWRHYYWFLTNEGIEFLRERLNLPQEVVPATLMKAQQSAQNAPPSTPAPVALDEADLCNFLGQISILITLVFLEFLRNRQKTQ